MFLLKLFLTPFLTPFFTPFLTLSQGAVGYVIQKKVVGTIELSTLGEIQPKNDLPVALRSTVSSVILLLFPYSPLINRSLTVTVGASVIKTVGHHISVLATTTSTLTTLAT